MTGPVGSPTAERTLAPPEHGHAERPVAETPAPSRPTVAVVIVNYNGLGTIEACLESLLADADGATEIVVVDNRSTDGSAEVVAQRFPGVQLILSPVNGGFGHGCNLAARASSAEFLAFLNPDTLVRPGWAAALVAALRARPHAGLATSRILLARTTDRLNAAGNDLHFTGLSLCRGVGLPRDTFPVTEEVGLISGAAFAISRRLFDRLGGFDEQYFLYVEDTDLSLRARLAGYACLYVPDSEVLHDYDLRFGPNKTYYLERNRYLLLLKVYRWSTLAALVPALLAAEVVTWTYLLLNQRSRAAEKLRAYRWVIRHWPAIMRARRRTQALRRVADRQLLDACVADLDYGQVGSSPALALARRVGNPVFRALFAGVRRLVRA